MEELLKVSKSTGKEDSDPLISCSLKQTSNSRLMRGDEQKLGVTVSSPEDVLRILRSKPSVLEIQSILDFLDNTRMTTGGFNLIVPSSKGALILHDLINTVVCDHWASLGMESSLKTSYQTSLNRAPKAMLLRCLQNVSGIGSLLAQLRSLVSKNHSQGKDTLSDKGLLIYATLIILSCLLAPDDILFRLYTDIHQLVDSALQTRLLWQEITSFLAASKVLSMTAGASKYMETSAQSSSLSWVFDGKHYAAWIGRNIGYFASQLPVNDDARWKDLVFFVGRSLSFGHADQVTGEILETLLFQQLDAGIDRFVTLMKSSQQYDQKRLMESSLSYIEKSYLNTEADDDRMSLAVSKTSAILHPIASHISSLSDLLKTWLISGASVGVTSVYMRRALLAIFSSDEESLSQVFTRSIDLFGDKLNIKHSPIKIQEANTQVIILTSGYLYRLDRLNFVTILQSSSYLSAISNHLGAASPRSRFLGMVVGTSLSKLADKPEDHMKFDLADMESEEALWYSGLSAIKDQIGNVEDLRMLRITQSTRSSKRNGPGIKPKTEGKDSPSPISSDLLLKKVESESEEEDFIPYQKPDEDASDSDEDPTLIERSKPSPPVYIRDLLMYLRDTDNYARYNLGISTAPSLIRRKATFGSELDEHGKDLALTLIGLQDKYNIPNFQEYRLQSLVKLIAARPSVLGPWSAHTFFNVDLSLTQRSSLLVALGLGVRDLAGHGEEDNNAMGLPALSTDTSFPSQQLPSRLRNQYDSVSKIDRIDAISKSIVRKSIEPLALNAADTLSGPNALKVRTFSSRMEVERKKNEREQLRRAKRIPKDLLKVLFEAFFRPLTGGFGLMLHSTSSYRGENPFFSPHLISLFVKTVNLIVSTIGPSSPEQLNITSDVLNLLMSLHNSPIATEPTVLTSILSLFIIVLDVNIASGHTGEERLVTEFVDQVMEMREWVGGIFERTPKGDDEVRTLAAGIMVKIGEITNRYQNRLFGMNSEFSF